ncbi:MAG TPA: AAA family ATPase, partial [Oligoflexia bacterium]|nr:AAA family ATPase [Oligoflexia bacterium]
MYIESLRLYQFRCFEELTLEPKRDFNVISGLNGQGKTSLLEAVGLLGSLKSFRHAKNLELVQFEKLEALV